MSKKWLLLLVAYHVAKENGLDLAKLAPTKNILHIPTDWKAAFANSQPDSRPSIASGFHGMKLFLTEFDEYSPPLHCYAPQNRPSPTFDLLQYENPQHGVRIQAGDYVIDGGGCWGDTALLFAHQTGPTGRVFSFEFVPENLAIFRQNLALNHLLADRIIVLEKALWDKPGAELAFRDNGPGTTVCADGDSDRSVITTSIDAMVESGEIPRVDFIKMDIEGAESRALAGSMKAIKRFRPHLALCIYHQPEDFVQLAEQLAALDLDYTFSIRHFTDSPWETVLYATVS